jgi:hypothetical protein
LIVLFLNSTRVDSHHDFILNLLDSPGFCSESNHLARPTFSILSSVSSFSLISALVVFNSLITCSIYGLKGVFCSFFISWSQGVSSGILLRRALNFCFAISVFNDGINFAKKLFLSIN